MIVRKAVFKDLSVIQQLADENLGIGYLTSPQLKHDLDASETSILVAELDEKVIGFCISLLADTFKMNSIFQDAAPYLRMSQEELLVLQTQKPDGMCLTLTID